MHAWIDMQIETSIHTYKYVMGLVYEERNEIDLARELFLECQRIRSKMHGPGHSMTVAAANAAQRASRCAEESV